MDWDRGRPGCSEPSMPNFPPFTQRARLQGPTTVVRRTTQDVKVKVAEQGTFWAPTNHPRPYARSPVPLPFQPGPGRSQCTGLSNCPQQRASNCSFLIPIFFNVRGMPSSLKYTSSRSPASALLSTFRPHAQRAEFGARCRGVTSPRRSGQLLGRRSRTNISRAAVW